MTKQEIKKLKEQGYVPVPEKISESFLVIGFVLFVFSLMGIVVCYQSFLKNMQTESWWMATIIFILVIVVFALSLTCLIYYFIYRFHCARIYKILRTGHYLVINNQNRTSEYYLMSHMTIAQLRSKNIIFVSSVKNRIN